MSHTPEPGDVVADKYVVEGLLGRGGMGAVYVVSHRLTGKRLALKCLLAEHREDTDIVDRFLREAQAAGRIQHRHVVDVFDVGQDGSVLFMVMPLLEGKPLSNLLKEEQLTLEELLDVITRAMEGVGAAHAQGIIHRDLKPDNIFVCLGPSGKLDDPRVLDFGISKRDDDASAPMTRSGVMMGTPYYMSFEQINSQRDLDQRVDVYAMGVILYEALCGSPPHMAETIGQLAIRMMSQQPNDLAGLRPDLPPGLAEAVMKGIARDREDRHPTMQAFIDALRPYHEQVAGSVLTAGGSASRNSSRSSLTTGRTVAEDATVPMRSPVPRELSVTAPDHRTPHMLRGLTGDMTPPRVIEPATGKGWWVVGALVLAAGLAGFVLFPTVSSKLRAGAPVAAPPAAVVPDSAPRTPTAPPPNQLRAPDPTPPDEQVAPAPTSDPSAQPAPVTAPQKRRRRRAVRRVAPGGERNVVLFVDAGVWEEEGVEDEAVGTPPAEAPVPANPGPDTVDESTPPAASDAKTPPAPSSETP